MGPEGGVQPLVVWGGEVGQGRQRLQRCWMPLLFQIQAVCVDGFLTTMTPLCEHVDQSCQVAAEGISPSLCGVLIAPEVLLVPQEHLAGWPGDRVESRQCSRRFSLALGQEALS